jgi:Na+:H+ antiporter, NhaA family
MAPIKLPLTGLEIRPVDRLLSPFQSFLKIEAAGGILLLVATIIALVWANSPWAESYEKIWHGTYFGLSLFEKADGTALFDLRMSLSHWVNDGIMVIFFFVVGLEIKREVLVGGLSSPKKAAVPIAAAMGGILFPALCYAAINIGGEGQAAKGWAIPTATDIAFALGIMALLGKRVPLSLKIFLTALAIVDDIGAVLIIAFFYTEGLDTVALMSGGGVLALLVLCNFLHVRRLVVYMMLGMILWYFVYKSGIHATIAGVLLAFTIPARSLLAGHDFVGFGRKAMDGYSEAGGDRDDIMADPVRQKLVHGIEKASEAVQPPLLRLEHIIHPWSAFLIMPIFALANAGVAIGDLSVLFTSSVSLGIFVGLIVGKQAGISLFTWLAVRLGWGDLPSGTTFKQVYAASWLAGIGFTMSLFIAGLGFGSGEELERAKMGILFASFVAGVVGYTLLRLFSPAPESDSN